MRLAVATSMAARRRRSDTITGTPRMPQSQRESLRGLRSRASAFRTVFAFRLSSELRTAALHRQRAIAARSQAPGPSVMLSGGCRRIDFERQRYPVERDLSLVQQIVFCKAEDRVSVLTVLAPSPCIRRSRELPQDGLSFWCRLSCRQQSALRETTVWSFSCQKIADCSHKLGIARRHSIHPSVEQDRWRAADTHLFAERSS